MKLIQIAHIENDFTTKFGLPRQGGLNPALKSLVVFERGFQMPEIIRGLDEFSHIWLLWGFSRAEYRGHTVRPPRLGGNQRRGVFATRSPFRPNPIGLTAVKLERLGEGFLSVSGADMMNGSPVYDIKPYLPYVDSVKNAEGGFAEKQADYRLRVEFPDRLKSRIPALKLPALIEALSEDPRPAYQRDPERIYGFEYAGLDVRFRVRADIIEVMEIV